MAKKRSLISRVFAAVAALVLISLIVSLVDASMGNPISAWKADKAIAKYVKDNYSFLDLEIEKSHYNFKFSEYSANVRSKTSKDTHFEISYKKGKVKYDGYQSSVIEKFNTISRLLDEYSALANSVASKELEYNKIKASVSFDKEKDLIGSDLIKLDMPFDKSIFPDSDIVISANMDKIDMDKVSDLLIKAHKAFAENGYTFNKYTLFLDNDDEHATVNVTAADIESGQLAKLLTPTKDGKHYGDVYVNINKKDK